jgi:pectate lyase
MWLRMLFVLPLLASCAAPAEPEGAVPERNVPSAEPDSGMNLHSDPPDSGTIIPPAPDGGIVATDSAAPATAADAGAPPAKVDECDGYPFSAKTLLDERLGFGASATGGDPSKVYRVKNLNDAGAGSLRAALESTEPYWIVFDVEGTITLGTDAIRPKSNKTVDGRGRAIVVDGTFKIDAGTKNVIFSDLSLKYPRGFAMSDGDTICIRGHAASTPDGYDSRDFWFHHIDFGRSGDGQLDVRGGTNITISWSHMHSHAKAFLHSQDTDDNPSPHQRITYHHNWFEKITRRGPLFYYGLADYFNNWQNQFYEFGASSNSGAQFLSENNIYEARPGSYCITGCADPNSPTGDSDYLVSKDALVSGWAGEPGYIRSVGDVAQNGAKLTSSEPSKVFSRASYYVAKPEPAGEELKARLKAFTGPRKTYCK